MTWRRLLAAAIMVGWFVVSPVAWGDVTPLYSAVHQRAGSKPTVTEAARFVALVGWPDQRVGHGVFWTYVKGTRSDDAHLPESWYLHVGGVRVRDVRFHSYVMDPRSAGWRRRVAAQCPGRCFVDGVGPTSIQRTSPRLPWTELQWARRAAALIHSIAVTGKRVLPNSIGSTLATARLYVAAAGRGSTEGFTFATRRVVTAGRVWVQERGGCSAKLAGYLLLRGRGDHFSCYEHGTLPWTVPSALAGPRLGRALGGAVRTRLGWRRAFRRGVLVVRRGGAYVIRR